MAGWLPPKAARRRALSRAMRASRPARTTAVFSAMPLSRAASFIRASSMFSVVLICINMHYQCSWGERQAALSGIAGPDETAWRDCRDQISKSSPRALARRRNASHFGRLQGYSDRVRLRQSITRPGNIGPGLRNSSGRENGIAMSRRLQPVPTVKCAGCDKTHRIRATNIRPADFYACSDACADKVPRIIGTIRVVEHHACAGFYGYTDRKPTAEELRSIARAQKLKELALESNKRGDW